MSETKKQLTREEFKDGLRGFNERIEQAQASGDSRTANEIYIESQKWIASVNGNQVVVGGRGNYPHGSRGV